MTRDPARLSRHLAAAAAMDEADPLAAYRGRFQMPDSDHPETAVYACGHSLGLQPERAREYIEAELDAWQRLGVRGHFEGERPWVKYEGLLRDHLAILTGARPSEVVVMNTLTLNLHLLLISFYRPTSRRYRVLIEANAFPSDRFAVESQVTLHGLDPTDAILEVAPASGEHIITLDDIASVLAAQGESIAVVLLPGVQYYTGQVFDLRAIAAVAHDHGCLMGADLAHAIGNVPLRLHDWNIDFAVWCSYKYLNGGPGGIGGGFVHERYAQSSARPRLAGWWGQRLDKRFQMQLAFDPSAGAEGWQVSTPPVLQLAALRASLEMFAEAGFEALHAKRIRLTRFFDELCDDLLGAPLARLTPRDPASRGAQISLDTRGFGVALHDRVSRRGVIGDWRPPGALRLSFAPLYASFRDVCLSVGALAASLDEP